MYGRSHWYKFYIHFKFWLDSNNKMKAQWSMMMKVVVMIDDFNDRLNCYYLRLLKWTLSAMNTIKNFSTSKWFYWFGHNNTFFKLHTYITYYLHKRRFDIAREYKMYVYPFKLTVISMLWEHAKYEGGKGDEEMDLEGEIKLRWNEMKIVIFSFPCTSS